jgi:vancomycin permeability regulator SanA
MKVIVKPQRFCAERVIFISKCAGIVTVGNKR